jgi:hypothetical protein
LTPYCELEVQKPTQTLKAVKGPGNTFDLTPKWARTLPFGIYFSWMCEYKKKKIGGRGGGGSLYDYPMKNILRTATEPQAHSRVFNINFDI